MSSFRDAAGRNWVVEINVSTIKRVRSLTGFDLLKMSDGSAIDQLSNDPVLLCDVLFACVKQEADKASISDEDFGRSLAGDAIEAATKAFLEAFVAFFPSPRRRVLDKCLDKMAGLQAAIMAAAEKHLDNLPTSGASSTAAPASSASTPAA